MKFTHSKEWVKSKRKIEGSSSIFNQRRSGSFGSRSHISIDDLHHAVSRDTRGKPLDKILCRIMPMGLINFHAIIDLHCYSREPLEDAFIKEELRKVSKQIGKEFFNT